MTGARTGPLRPVRLAHGDHCSRCKFAAIIWTTTERGARRAVDALPHIDGDIELEFHEDGRPPTSRTLTGLFRAQAEVGSLYNDHRASCPALDRRRP